MSYELEGILHKVYEVVSKSATFQTREFVVKTDGQYPQFIKFQCTQDRVGIIDGHNEGEPLKVYFDLRGREWNEKYFTNLNAWRVEKPAAAAAPEASAVSSISDPSFPKEEPGNSSSNSSTKVEEFDDLPF